MPWHLHFLSEHNMKKNVGEYVREMTFCPSGMCLIRLSGTFRHKLVSHSFTTIPSLVTRGLSYWSSELATVIGYLQ